MNISNISQYFQIQKSLKYIFMLIAYILCFIFIFREKTEYLCFILLLTLNIFLMIMMLVSKIIVSENDYIFEKTMKIVFAIDWILLFISNIQIIDIYRKMSVAYQKIGEPINLGESTSKKNLFKLLLVLSTICLILLFIITITPPSFRYGSLIILFSIIAIFLSCICLYLSNYISVRTDSIPKMIMNRIV